MGAGQDGGEGGLLLHSKFRAVAVVTEPMISFYLPLTMETLSSFAATGLEPWRLFSLFFSFLSFCRMHSGLAHVESELSRSM